MMSEIMSGNPCTQIMHSLYLNYTYSSTAKIGRVDSAGPLSIFVSCTK
jgi:hypothetical protein